MKPLAHVQREFCLTELKLLHDGKNETPRRQDGPRQVITGRIKWYEASRGYGFIIPDDGGRDVMIHEACVRAFGHAALPEGAPIRLTVARGEKGLYAVEILEIDHRAPAEPRDDGTAPRPTDFLQPEATSGPLLPARVRWFDRQKGFGFVNVFGEAEDIFLHMETVRRCGLKDLASGEGIAVRLCQGPNGVMVSDLKLWEAGILSKLRDEAISG